MDRIQLEAGIRENLASLGCVLEDSIISQLAQRSSSILGAVEYYFTNSELFESQRKEAEQQKQRQQQQQQPLPAPVTVFNVPPRGSDEEANSTIAVKASAVVAAVSALLVPPSSPTNGDNNNENSGGSYSAATTAVAVSQPRMPVPISRNNSATGKWPAELADYKEDRIAQALMELSCPTALILKAVKTCSSVEAAVNLMYEEPVEEAMLLCSVCGCEEVASATFTLECNHRICAECFEGYVTNKISENLCDAEGLSCPALLEGKGNAVCRSPISIFEIKAAVSEEVFNKYERFSTRAFCEGEDLRRCPKCNEWYVDLRDAVAHNNTDVFAKVKCGKCEHEFCGKCGEIPHMKEKELKVSCEEYAKWRKENEEGDESFLKYVKEEKLFPCPKCKRYAELKSGCKFLYCICKSKFCAICGIQLQESQHFTHFKGGPGCTGPFGDGCLGVTDTAGVS